MSRRPINTNGLGLRGRIIFAIVGVAIVVIFAILALT